MATLLTLVSDTLSSSPPSIFTQLALERDTVPYYSIASTLLAVTVTAVTTFLALGKPKPKPHPVAFRVLASGRILSSSPTAAKGIQRNPRKDLGVCEWDDDDFRAGFVRTEPAIFDGRDRDDDNGGLETFDGIEERPSDDDDDDEKSKRRAGARLSSSGASFHLLLRPSGGNWSSTGVSTLTLDTSLETSTVGDDDTIRSDDTQDPPSRYGDLGSVGGGSGAGRRPKETMPRTKGKGSGNDDDNGGGASTRSPIAWVRDRRRTASGRRSRSAN